VFYYSAVAAEVSMADYMAFNTAYGMLSGAVGSLAAIAYIIARIKPTLEMVEPILRTAPEVSTSKRVVEKISGAIELNNVSFETVVNSVNCVTADAAVKDAAVLVIVNVVVKEVSNRVTDHNRIYLCVGCDNCVVHDIELTAAGVGVGFSVGQELTGFNELITECHNNLLKIIRYINVTTYFPIFQYAMDFFTCSC
jgi:hypothetical protein